MLLPTLPPRRPAPVFHALQATERSMREHLRSGAAPRRLGPGGHPLRCLPVRAAATGRAPSAPTGARRQRPSAAANATHAQGQKSWRQRRDPTAPKRPCDSQAPLAAKAPRAPHHTQQLGSESPTVAHCPADAPILGALGFTPGAKLRAASLRRLPLSAGRPCLAKSAARWGACPGPQRCLVQNKLG
jgi:hypothetical protein